MGWVYRVTSKEFYLNGVYRFSAEYSGRPGYKNKVENACVIGRGPIPRGNYTIGKPFTHHKTGRYTLRLTPAASNQMCGRDGFMIHGDSARHPGEASDGCIILNIDGREIIASSHDNSLTVID